MIKFEHTLFALPLAYAGAFLGANGWPGWWKSLFILAAMVGARSAAMSFNRLVDLPFDKKNPRTLDRELPSGRLGRKNVWYFMGGSCALFFLSALFLGRWCLYLSPVALVVVLGYSYTKRFTWACHIFLGLALAMAPLGGFLAVTGRITLPAIILAIGVLLWVAGFDIIYACQDTAFDERVGLKSIPVRMGKASALKISSFFHAAAFVSFMLAGLLAGLRWPYYLGTVVAGGLLFWEHRIVSGGNLKRIELAFFTVNSYVSVSVLAGVVAAYVL